MKRKTNIVVNLQISGIHNWRHMPKDESLDPVRFLSRDHMHVFHITAKKEVNHSDRDIEIIMFRGEIGNHMKSNFPVDTCGNVYFGSMSCEMLAEHLVDQFDLSYCSVLEDGNFGAEVIVK